MKRIEEQMVLGYELISLFKEEAAVLRQDINVLMNRLMESVESVSEDVKPETYKDYKTLKANIKSQKDENELLMKMLGTVSRETAEQREKVSVCSERILRMEEAVGMIAHNPVYKDDLEDELYMDSLTKNETIDHTYGVSPEEQTREPPSERGARKSEMYDTGLALNPASASSSVEPKEWVDVEGDDNPVLIEQ